MTSRRFDAHAASDRKFWEELCPELTIEGSHEPPSGNLPGVEALHARLLFEGYVNEPDVIPLDYLRPLRDCVSRLHAAGIPPVFAFIYDEFWLAFRSVSPFLSKVLGPAWQSRPIMWAWCIDPTERASGWAPHRDSSIEALEADGAPAVLTVWIPLTHATPLNGCLYVLPWHLDETRDLSSVAPPFSLQGEQLQNIRALPAPTGSVLAWHHRLLHWGGRSSELAGEPRMSIACQFQRADRPSASRLIPPAVMPPFQMRLGIIGTLIQKHATQFNESCDPQTKCLAMALAWKYDREETRHEIA